MTFDEMVEIEPMLGNLKTEAEMYSHISWKDKENLWYRDFKKRMSRMVGFSASNPKLSSSKCYEIAYKTISEALKV